MFSLRELGSRAICHSTDFNETLPKTLLNFYLKTQNDKLGSV